MKKYNTPQMNLIRLDPSDILTVSGFDYLEEGEGDRIDYDKWFK